MMDDDWWRIAINFTVPYQRTELKFIIFFSEREGLWGTEAGGKLPGKRRRGPYLTGTERKDGSSSK